MVESNAFRYEGYVDEIYDGYQRVSQYITMSDGCKCAVDIYRPTKDRALHEEKLPLLWCATQYRRRLASNPDATLEEVADIWFTPCTIGRFVTHGYILAIVDVRGAGASFGNRTVADLSLQDMTDLYDTNELLARLPYCDGQTGMFGASFLATEMWACAAMAPPSLKAIVPNVGPLEIPRQVYNGVFNTAHMGGLDESMRRMNCIETSASVDEDTDGALLVESIKIKENNPSSIEQHEAMPYFDSISPFHQYRTHVFAYLGNYITNIENSGIAVYILGGWKDFFTMDCVEWFNTLKKTPKKMLIGPWFHTDSVFCYDGKLMKYGKLLEGEYPYFDWTVEHLRWYDYWLKGIDNGIMDEPPVCLYDNEKDEDKAWNYYPSFPFPDAEDITFYLDPRKSGTVSSINDGTLGRLKPQTSDTHLTYDVDYEVTKDGYWERFHYTAGGSADFKTFDEKAITFTTSSAAADMHYAGIPVIRLYDKASSDNVDFHINLQDIDENGISRNITEGRMRTDIRMEADAVFNTCGTPYHKNSMRNQDKLPKDYPAEISFWLFPISWVVKQGHRLRVTIYNYDKGHWDTPRLNETPVVSIYYSKEFPSTLKLPRFPRMK